VITGRRCPLAEQADVILSSLTTLPEGRSIAASHGTQLPQTPLLLNVAPHEAAWLVREALGHHYQ
jgi:hypothetical protein